MAQEKFSQKEAVSFGWERMKTNFWLFVAILLTLAGVSVMSDRIDQQQEAIPELLLVSLAIWIFYMVVEMGLIRISLDIHDGKKAEYFDLFSEYKKVFNYFLSSLIYGAIVLVGLILLIVPGVIWGIKFQFFGYFIVDKNLGPIEALKASAKITSGSKLHLFLFGLLLLGVVILGFLALIVGLFAAIPTTMLAMAFVYRKLGISENKEISKEASPKIEANTGSQDMGEKQENEEENKNQ